MSGDIGDYYDRKREEADRLREQIERTTDEAELAMLRERLEQALYVGD